MLSPDEFKKVRSRKRTAPRRIANRKQTGISNVFEPQFAIRNSIRIANPSGHYAFDWFVIAFLSNAHVIVTYKPISNGDATLNPPTCEAGYGVGELSFLL